MGRFPVSEAKEAALIALESMLKLHGIDEEGMINALRARHIAIWQDKGRR